MGAHFALGDVAAFRLQDVLDWVFQGDDVLAALPINLLDQSRQGGRFSAADRARDQNQSVLIAGQKFQLLGQTELIHRAHLGVDDAKHEIDPEALTDDAGAVATKRIRIGEVSVATLVQLGLVQLREKTLRQSKGLVRRETRCLGPDWLKRSVQSPERRRVYSQVNIRGAGVLPDSQIIIDVRKWIGRGHGGTQRLLRSAPAPVNSKTFLIGTAARSVAAKLLLKKTHDDRFDETGHNPGHA